MLKIKSIRVKDLEGHIHHFKSNMCRVSCENHVMSIMVKSNINIQAHSARIVCYEHPLMSGDMLANGYQTWTETKRMGKDDTVKPLLKLAKSFHMDKYGDYHFYKGKHTKGFIHSHEFTDFQVGEDVLLVGSLNQQQFYTVLERDYEKGLFAFYLDIDGLSIDKGEWFDFGKYFMAKHHEIDVLYDAYAKLIKGPRSSGKRINGWTSWYNYYTKIDDQIINHNLDLLTEHELEFNVFQMDDGYQERVGDWLTTNDKFKDDLSEIAVKAKEKGMKPGIWLAPFICERKSTIFKEHKEWLVQDSEGKPLVAGFNPGWSFNYYALDIYNEDVKTYLREVFSKVFGEWQYELVKLDFLYAVNILPRPGKTRAMVMADAMAFLDEVCTGEILACGIPMGSALKTVEYSRIGADVASYWEDKRLRFLGYRERISTRAAIYNTLNRHVMNERFFGNDPDVFIIRKNDNKLTEDEKFTLFAVNQILGQLVFFSDDISTYTDEINYLKSVEDMPKVSQVKVTVTRDIYTVKFRAGNHPYEMIVNMSDQSKTVKIRKDDYYLSKLDEIVKISKIKVKAHETIILVPIEEDCAIQLDKSRLLPIIGA